MTGSLTTLVIPAHGSAKTIRKAVVSAGSRPAVVILDGPDAEARGALGGLADVQILELPSPRGAPACRNLGWRSASTEYVMFLDADDYIEGPFVEAAEAAAEEQGADLVIGRFAFEFSDGRRRIVDPSQFYGRFDPETIMKRWLVGDYTPPCALVWRRSFVERLGGWDESLSKNQDGDLMYRALFQRPRIASADAGQGIYVQDEDPKRITRRHDRRMLASQIAVLDKIRTRLDHETFDPREELGRAYYNLARLAFTHRVDEIGETAERAARELGVQGQPGAFVHSLAATIFGLRRKQRLAKIVREAPGNPRGLLEVSQALR